MMTLSELLAYNTDHLIEAAAHWRALADQREEVFAAVRNEALSLPWEGLAADATHARTHADSGTATDSAENLRGAASIAQDSAGTLDQMHSRALYTIEDAQADGFTPSEALQFVDTKLSSNPAVAAQRQAQAQAYSGQLKAQVAALYTHDAEVGTKLINATAGEGTVQFAETPAAQKPKFEPVDSHTFKQGPDQPGTGPNDPHPLFPSRNNNGRFGKGNTGSADGAAAAEQRLKEFERDNHTSVIRQQVRAAIIDPQTGQPMLDPKTGNPLYRYYDGLEPVPGQPGKYVGIEVKSGTADLTRTQKIFDKAVSPDTPATANLNGEPIEIIGAEKLQAPQFIPERPPAPAEPAAPDPAVRAPIEAAPAPRAPPLEGGFWGGPSENPLPHFVDPKPHHHPHIVGEWGPDSEDAP